MIAADMFAGDSCEAYKPSRNPRNRFREIGNRIDPAHAQLREYLMLDGATHLWNSYNGYRLTKF